MNKIVCLVCCLFLLSENSKSQVKEDEFLHDLYDKMHDSPMQQKIRKNSSDAVWSGFSSMGRVYRARYA